MDNYLVPHTKSSNFQQVGKSSANPSIYKYHDFVRTRQHLQFDEKDLIINKKGLPIELQGNSTADAKG